MFKTSRFRRKPLEIRPNFGLGALEFRTSPAEAKMYLGDPDEIDEHSEAEAVRVGWSYHDLRLDVLFQTGAWISESLSVTDPRLTLFTTSNPKVALWGTKIMGLRDEKVRRLLITGGHPELYEIEEDSYPDHIKRDIKILRSRTLNLDLHFSKGRLDSCQWGCFPL
jgi:hypothetical protein